MHQRVRAARATNPAQRRRVRGVGADLEKPTHGIPVELDLVDRLTGTELAQLGWAVRGQHDQRGVGFTRLDHRRREVGRRGTRGAGDRDGSALARARPSAKKSPLRSSMCEWARRPGWRASASTSGAERDPGEVHASVTPQRASSSTKAARSRWVSRGAVKMWACQRPSSWCTASRRPRAHWDRGPRGAR